MAEVSLAQTHTDVKHTHTDEQESGCTVICFAITHKMCASCHRGGGWVLHKNLIAKAFICQLLALKSFPTPFFSCSICMTLTGCCFMLTKKREVSEKQTESSVCLWFSMCLPWGEGGTSLNSIPVTFGLLCLNTRIDAADLIPLNSGCVVCSNVRQTCLLQKKEKQLYSLIFKPL